MHRRIGPSTRSRSSIRDDACAAHVRRPSDSSRWTHDCSTRRSSADVSVCSVTASSQVRRPDASRRCTHRAATRRATLSASRRSLAVDAHVRHATDSSWLSSKVSPRRWLSSLRRASRRSSSRALKPRERPWLSRCLPTRATRCRLSRRAAALSRHCCTAPSSSIALQMARAWPSCSSSVTARLVAPAHSRNADARPCAVHCLSAWPMQLSCAHCPAHASKACTSLPAFQRSTALLHVVLSALSAALDCHTGHARCSSRWIHARSALPITPRLARRSDADARQPRKAAMRDARRHVRAGFLAVQWTSACTIRSRTTMRFSAASRQCRSAETRPHRRHVSTAWPMFAISTVRPPHRLKAAPAAPRLQTSQASRTLRSDPLNCAQLRSARARLPARQRTMASRRSFSSAASSAMRHHVRHARLMLRWIQHLAARRAVRVSNARPAAAHARKAAPAVECHHRAAAVCARRHREPPRTRAPIAARRAHVRQANMALRSRRSERSPRPAATAHTASDVASPRRTPRAIASSPWKARAAPRIAHRRSHVRLSAPSLRCKVRSASHPAATAAAQVAKAGSSVRRCHCSESRSICARASASADVPTSKRHRRHAAPSASCDRASPLSEASRSARPAVVAPAVHRTQPPPRRRDRPRDSPSTARSRRASRASAATAHHRHATSSRWRPDAPPSSSSRAAASEALAHSRSPDHPR